MMRRFFAFAATAIVATGCGQITGLSDDYNYDLVDGGDAAADAGGGADGSSPADAGVDAAAAEKCSQQEQQTVNQQLSSVGGTASCRLCVAGQCCADAFACLQSGDCKNRLQCEVECSAKSANERTACLHDCARGGPSSSPYDTTIGACLTASCASRCGF